MAKRIRTKRKEKKNVPSGVVHIQSTFNNTIVTITDPGGNVVSWSSSGVQGFKNMYNQFAEYAPLMQPITIEDVGNTAVYLCSDLAAKTTGEIVFVDSGYNIIGVPIPRDDVDCE